MLKRWFYNGYSEGLRDWAEGFMQLKPCESCGGARLKKESLWFRVNDPEYCELSNMNLITFAAWMDGIELRISNKQKTIAKGCTKGNQGPAAILAGRGSYLSHIKQNFQIIEVVVKVSGYDSLHK
jgi:excinuclease UvrABC ATPase subunit